MVVNVLRDEYRWIVFYASIATRNSVNQMAEFFSIRSSLSKPMFYKLAKVAFEKRYVEKAENTYRILPRGWLDFVEKMKALDSFVLEGSGKEEHRWAKSLARWAIEHSDLLHFRLLREKLEENGLMISKNEYQQFVTPFFNTSFIHENTHYRYVVYTNLSFTPEPEFLIKIAFMFLGKETPWVLYNPAIVDEPEEWCEWRGHHVYSLLDALFRWKERYRGRLDEIPYKRELFRIIIDDTRIGLIEITGYINLKTLDELLEENSRIPIDNIRIKLFVPNIFFGRYSILENLGIESGVFVEMFRDKKPQYIINNTASTDMSIEDDGLILLKEKLPTGEYISVLHPKTGMLPIIMPNRMEHERKIALRELKYIPPPVNLLQIEGNWY